MVRWESDEYPIVQYTIDAGAYVYQVNLVLHNDREKHPAVTIKAPIKFAIDNKSDFAHSGRAAASNTNS